MGCVTQDMEVESIASAEEAEHQEVLNDTRGALFGQFEEAMQTPLSETSPLEPHAQKAGHTPPQAQEPPPTRPVGPELPPSLEPS